MLGSTLEAYATAAELASRYKRPTLIIEQISGMSPIAPALSALSASPRSCIPDIARRAPPPTFRAARPAPRPPPTLFSVHTPVLDPALAHLTTLALGGWQDVLREEPSLLARVGSLDVGPTGPLPVERGGSPRGSPSSPSLFEELGGIDGLQDVCRTVGIPHDMLTPADIAKRSAQPRPRQP